MTVAPSVVVVVPARDERLAICPTVHSVAAAVRAARRRRVIGMVSLQVVAHRCTDDTADRARSCLRLVRGAAVVEDAESTTIGQARDRGARRGLATVRSAPESCWVLSTDADTRVPRDWVVRILRQAHRHAATAVVGLAELDRFRGSPEAQTTYRRILEGKLVAGEGLHQHDHVYGANLAIRADSYLASGGFPHVPHGEDQQLVDELVSAGTRVLRTRDVTVTTSGRLEGRAEDGLARLLRRLDDGSDVSVDRSWAPQDRPVNAGMTAPTLKGSPP